MESIEMDLRNLVSALNMPILIHSANSKKIIWANPPALEMLGYSLDELQALKAHHMSVNEELYSREAGLAWLQSAVIHGKSRNTWKYQTASGEPLLVNAVATHVNFHKGPVIVVEFHPIAETSSTNRPKWVANSLERLMTHTSSGLLVLDRSYRVQDVSPFAAGLFGRRPAELLGAYLGSLGTIDPELGSEEAKEQLDANGQQLNIRMKIIDREGNTRWLAGLLEDVMVENSQFKVLTVRDITERINWERKVAFQESNLQYLSRYNAMGDMAMIMAHDLGQPLAASRNYLNGLQARIASGKATKDTVAYALEQMEIQIKRASDIVSSAKRYVRRIESAETEFDLAETIEESLYFVRLKATELGIAIDIDLGNQPLPVKGESVLIGQVIINLCMNALQEISKPSTQVKELRIKARRERSFATILISDQGEGMSSAPRNRLVDGAFSTKEDGSGIGLIISEQIIERHGGELSFRKNSPQGTVAKVSLPLRNAQRTNPSDHMAPNLGA